MNGEPLFTAFAAESCHFWDHSTGAPTESHFANALQVWSACQNRKVVTVAEAALAFNVRPDLIEQAVLGHPWMILASDGAIEHEGE